MTAITVSNIVLRDVEPPIIKAAQVPEGEYLIDTRPGRRDGTRPADVVPGPVEPEPSVGVLFQDGFDDQPDWHSGLPENNTGAFPVNGAGPDRIQRQGTHTIPQNWYSVYQDPKWAPSVGHPDRNESIEILASNADKARGGTGKCFVQRRDAGDDNGWEWYSDGQLLKLLQPGYFGLYIEFYIAFDPNWTVTPSEAASKLFRVGSWNGVGSEFQAFGGGNQGPLFLWDWKRDNFGVRNLHTLRGGPWGENYTLTAEQRGSHPRGSLNFTSDIAGMGVGGTNPQIPDKLNGGFIPGSGIIEHAQVYGPGGTYTKVAFYVQMNSAPGVADGWVMQWIEDVQMMNVRDITWVPSLPTGISEMPKWNFFSIGGNDFFKIYPSSERRQEWWAVDDLLVRDSIPEALINE